jgi:4-hydroxy-3-polyprenylbenzoate decarboxylase
MDLKFLYEDLRGWIGQARQIGEVRDVEGATWQEEIGMATEFLHHSDPAPAALFDKIPGYPKGYRILTNFFGGKRMNMTLGFPQGLSRVELSNEFIKAFQGAKPIPYQFVEDGPVFENVRMGDEVDVLSFPSVARNGWRTLYWNRKSGHHSGPRRGLDQSGDLSGHGPR